MVRHPTSVRMVSSERQQVASGGERVLCMARGERTSVHPPWETAWGFLRKLNIELLCDSAIPLLGVYPKHIKSHLEEMPAPHVHNSQDVETPQVSRGGE